MDRRALKREYKQSQPTMGIYRILNTVDDRALVGSSVNVPAMLNRLRAQLGMGVHTNRQLQADWNRHGAEAFRFEVMDTLAPRDDADYDPAPDLRALEELWCDRLSPYGDGGYNKAPG